jgi:hypothetical protein
VEAATGGVRGKSSDEGGGGTDTDGEKKEAEGLGWAAGSRVGMKTDRIQTDITDIVFVFIFMSGFGFEYG